MRTYHTGSVVWAVALHVAVVTALLLGFRLPSRPHFAASPAPIQGVIVDQSVIQKEEQRREQLARAEQERKQREERQKREAIEQQKRDKEAAAKREQDRLATEQAERERVAREKAATAKREQERVAQEKREAEARAKRERDEAERKRRETAAKQQREAEDQLQRDLAAENARMQAERSGVLDEYIRLIEDKIERNWNRPLSAKPGLDCVVNVVQIPSGDVVAVRVGQCNGDEAVVRSIEAAVRNASPLPKPPTQAVFERNLNVHFRPDL
jgi:colicin import membrane protein